MNRSETKIKKNRVLFSHNENIIIRNARQFNCAIKMHWEQLNKDIMVDGRRTIVREKKRH